MAFMSDIIEQRVEKIRRLNPNGKPGSEPRVSKVIEKIHNISIICDKIFINSIVITISNYSYQNWK